MFHSSHAVPSMLVCLHFESRLTCIRIIVLVTGVGIVCSRPRDLDVPVAGTLDFSVNKDQCNVLPIRQNCYFLCIRRILPEGEKYVQSLQLDIEYNAQGKSNKKN